MLLTLYRSFKHFEAIFTISAVAPFLTGLQFINKTFISFLLQLPICQFSRAKYTINTNDIQPPFIGADSSSNIM